MLSKFFKNVSFFKNHLMRYPTTLLYRIQLANFVVALTYKFFIRESKDSEQKNSELMTVIIHLRKTQSLLFGMQILIPHTKFLLLFPTNEQ